MYDKREALIKRRNQLGLTQQAIADKLGILRGSYQNIENGVCNTSVDNCRKIGELLKMDFFVLMNRINKDLNIYDKNEPLKVVGISFTNRDGKDYIDMIQVENSHEKKQNFTIDQFSNILYYRYKNGYSLNIDYQAHDCEEEYKKNKREAMIKRRKELGLSQQAIAEQLGISQNAYCCIENGATNPSIETCISLRRVLGVNPFVFMGSTKYDLNIYAKNEPLKLIWIFINKTSGACIDMLRIEDSHEEWKDLTLDEFSNVLYYRYINGFSLNITYKAHGSEDLELLYVKDKSQSLLTWCNSQGEFGQYIIENAQLPYGITLADFSKSSHKKININCPKHGIYSQMVFTITRQYGCPECNTRSTSYPEQFIYWALKQLYQKCKSRHKIEGLEVDVFIPEKNTCIEYNGYIWHKGKEYMDLQKRNHIEYLGYSLITINEHREKGDTVFSGNNIDFYYTYSNRNDRLKELVCRILKEILHVDRRSLIDFKTVEKNAWEYSKGKIEYEKSVAYLFPELTKEWDASNSIKPEDATHSSNQRIKWVCKNCGSKWKAIIAARTQYKTGCTSCRFNIFDGKIHSWEEKAKNADNNVVKLYPELAKEFLPELNEGKQLEDYTSGSTVRMTWKCQNCGNEWQAKIDTRTRHKTGCSSCGYNVFIDKINIRSIKQNDSVLKTYPELAKEFLPELNEGKQLEDYTAGSNVKITWKCTNCGNEWTTEIRNRTRDKSGCSTCGYNVFIDKINPHGIYHKKQPIAVVNGVEIYI